MTINNNLEPQASEEEATAAAIVEDSKAHGQEAVADSLTEETADAVGAPQAPEEELETAATATEAYFEDDEDFLAGDDRVIDETDALGLFAQDQDVVAWDIEGLYDDDLELLPKSVIRSSPPVLTIKSTSGDTASFILTRGFARHMGEGLKRVESAYFGVDSRNPEKLTAKERLQRFGDWIKTHPVKTGLAAIVIGLVVYTLVVL